MKEDSMMNMKENVDVVYKLKWFNNPDNQKGTDTVAWIPRKLLAEAIAEIGDLRDQLLEKEMSGVQRFS